MHRRLVALSAALVVAACRPADGERAVGPEPDASRPVSPDQAAQPVEATAPQSLVGEYRVAGVDGADVNLPYGIGASISEERIHVVADCVNVAWTYRYDAGRLATERAPVEGCGRGLVPLEEALVAAFDVAERVTRTPSNGLEFTGGGHSVLLFSQ